MKICICGGGNLGHVVAGFLAAQPTHQVSLLTRHPERWTHHLLIDTPNGEVLKGELCHISTHAKEVIPSAELVLLCLPGYALHDTLEQISKYLWPHVPVGSIVSSTGFFFEALDILPDTTPLFGFQRVPFIARTTQYGHQASLLGYKPQLNLAIERGGEATEALRETLQEMLHTPISLLDNYYEASLTNSNPLLHTARLYELWHSWHKEIIYKEVPLFYTDWTDEAAQLYIQMDEELQTLLSKLKVKQGAIPTVLDYYESTDAHSLSKKLSSIAAFQGIPAPMKAVEGGYQPDFSSRYFTEDFPYGLAIIHRLAHQHGVEVPHINKVYEWGMCQLSK